MDDSSPLQALVVVTIDARRYRRIFSRSFTRSGNSRSSLSHAGHVKDAQRQARELMVLQHPFGQGLSVKSSGRAEPPGGLIHQLEIADDM